MHEFSNSLDAKLTALEAQLAGLRPAAGGIDRDRLMFAAGQRAARRRLRVARGWLAATSVACGALLALQITGWWQGASRQDGSLIGADQLASPAAGQTSPAIAQPANNSPWPAPVAPGSMAGQAAPSIVTNYDATVLLRLRERLGRDPWAEIAQHTDRTGRPPEVEVTQAPRKWRSDLDSYLRETSGGL